MPRLDPDSAPAFFFMPVFVSIIVSTLSLMSRSLLPKGIGKGIGDKPRLNFGINRGLSPVIPCYSAAASPARWRSGESGSLERLNAASSRFHLVIPAQAGIQEFRATDWFPAIKGTAALCLYQASSG
jgi:hypothetical protein